jgi:hypothetical protein
VCSSDLAAAEAVAQGKARGLRDFCRLLLRKKLGPRPEASPARSHEPAAVGEALLPPAMDQEEIRALEASLADLLPPPPPYLVHGQLQADSNTRVPGGEGDDGTEGPSAGDASLDQAVHAREVANGSLALQLDTAATPDRDSSPSTGPAPGARPPETLSHTTASDDANASALLLLLSQPSTSMLAKAAPQQSTTEEPAQWEPR